jgi:hypothetical protein
VVLVLDVSAQDLQVVELGCERGRDRGLRRVVGIGDLSGRPGGDDLD